MRFCVSICSVIRDGFRNNGKFWFLIACLGIIFVRSAKTLGESDLCVDKGSECRVGDGGSVVIGDTGVVGLVGAGDDDGGVVGSIVRHMDYRG